MTVLMIPAMEPPGERYPSLGPAICDWIEASLVFGPGDLRGDPARLDDEKKALICRMYELYPRDYPPDPQGRPQAGMLSKMNWETILRKWGCIWDTPPTTRPSIKRF